MSNRDFSKLHKQLRDSVRKACKDINFAGLRQSVTDSVNETIKRTHEGLARHASARASKPQEPQKPVIRVCYPSRVGGVLCTVFGAIGATVSGAFVLLGLLAAAITGMQHTLLAVFLAAVTIPFALFAAMTGFGISTQNRRRRVRKYLEAADGRTYCPVEQLAAYSGKSSAYVRRDVQRLIQKGILPEAHLDEEQSCLILDKPTYALYLQSREAMRQREQQAAQQEAAAPQDSGLRDMVAEGERCIHILRQANREIAGQAISAKLDRLEHVLRKIFEALGRHPEKAGEMQRFMDYYLPTTIKLVNTYREMDQVSIEGDNIRSTKSEIEHTLDTINKGFETLLDELYEDMAFDASTDAAVLQTMLAKDGWTGSDFKREDEKK